jgi:hypothetical protein
VGAEKVLESIQGLLGGSPAAMFVVLWKIPIHMGGGLPSCISAASWDSAVEAGKEFDKVGLPEA